MDSGRGERILVDAHVHLHSCFDVVGFVDGAFANFKRAAQQFGSEHRFVGALLLTEGRSEHGFQRLLRHVKEQTGLGTWRLHRTQERTSLYLTSGNDRVLVVVAGRQIVSRERLEVLALGTRRDFEEGRSTRDVIRDVARAGALPVVPWGFGKWVGARGRLLKRLVQDPRLPRFFLGDSANRPALWSRPALFRRAEERGIRNLPGSDPLPLTTESQRAGRCGCVVRGVLDREMPARDLKEKLSDPSTTVHSFGKGETPFRFVRNQLAMQFRKVANR